MTTIKLYNGKTFSNLSDAEKPDLGARLVEREIMCNVNTMVLELHKSSIELGSDYAEELQNLIECTDYETPVIEHIENLDSEELEELAGEYDCNADSDSIIEALEGDFESFAYEYDIEPHYVEVYEHWVVTDWVGRQLKELGQPVEEIGCTTIWGRCTTGQSIKLDGIIQKLAFECFCDEIEDKIYNAKMAALDVALQSVKEDIRPFVKKVIITEETAYKVSFEMSAKDTNEQENNKRTLERNVKKVKEMIADYI